MLEVVGLRKTFAGHGAPVKAIDDVSLTLAGGKLLTMLGPSGCGKTTTLRCIAGLERADAGRIVIGGRVMVDVARGIFVPAAERGIGMVFQSYAIWPHMSVFENVAFPLRVARDRRYPQAEVRRLVLGALDMVRLGGFEDRRATQLSGGQQQRLAFARGIVRTPSLLLLDEPLSNLDARLRDEMRAELTRLQTSLSLTTLYVTHDQAEALALSDEVALFQAGRVVQKGPPSEIYRHPTSRFVADFIGAANFLPGTVDAGGIGPMAVQTSRGVIRSVADIVVAAGASVMLAIRPEAIQLRGDAGAHADNVVPAEVASRSYLGDLVEYVVIVGEEKLRVRVSPDLDFARGQKVFAAWSARDCLVLTS